MVANVVTAWIMCGGDRTRVAEVVQGGGGRAKCRIHTRFLHVVYATKAVKVRVRGLRLRSVKDCVCFPDCEHFSDVSAN